MSTLASRKAAVTPLTTFTSLRLFNSLSERAGNSPHLIRIPSIADNKVDHCLKLRSYSTKSTRRINHPRNRDDIPTCVRPSPPLIVWAGLSCDIIYNEPTKPRQSHAILIPLPSERDFVRMRSYIQFITTPTSDTPGTALLLHFDNKRYLIGNIHEGTQRASIQRATRLTKVSDIFLTGKTEWKTSGGLLGMILTLADATSTAAVATAQSAKLKLRRKREGQQDGTLKGEANQEQILPERNTLTIHGGPNVTHMLATARRFIFRKGMRVHVDEVQGDCKTNRVPTWSDENIRVWAMGILPTSSRASSPPARPQSPRKRSFDEYQDTDPLSSTLPVIGEDKDISKQEDRNRQIRLGVVSDMFDSAWRLDALVETPLANVQMPATLFIRNPETKNIEKYLGPLPGGDEPMPNVNVLVRKPWPGALIEHLPPTIPSKTAMAYIIRNHPQRGKFLPQRAIALNVEKGYRWSQLTQGIPVQSMDGKTVTPEEVLEAGKEGCGIAIVELPSRDYVKGLTERPEWRVPGVMKGVEAVIWILGPGVGEDEELRSFMTEFKHLRHIVSSQDYCPNYLPLDSSATAAIRLNQIDPLRHPVPVHDNVALPQLGQPSLQSPSHSDWIPASRGLTVQLEPEMTIKNESIVPPLNTALVIEKTPKDVLALGKAAREEVSSEEFQKGLDNQNLPSPDAEIVCLGTGSALPSKYRNVSATLLRVPGCGSYLLDCGENTLGQLKRIYTPDQLQEVLCDLKLIWISHLHADHHLGTTSVIKAWYEAVYGREPALEDSPNYAPTERVINPAKFLIEEKRLFVASDGAMLKWLEEYASMENYGFDKLVPLSVYGAKLGSPNSTKLVWNSTLVSFGADNPLINTAMQAATGLTNLAATNVNHCHGSKAVSLTFRTGFRFSYSGDCRPSRAFAEIGKGSTVLLHEATFEDELRGDAEAKKHSTTSEAIGVGVAMGARRVLLTHFSQRYQKIPVMGGIDGQELKLEDDDSSGDLTADIEGGETRGQERNLGVMVENDTAIDEILGINPPPQSIRRNTSRSRSRSNSNGDNAQPESPNSKSQALNHTSQLHLSRPKPKARDMKVGVAYDYMRIKVRDIAVLEKFTPTLLKLFEESEPEMELEPEVESEVGVKQENKSDRNEKEGDAKSNRNNKSQKQGKNDKKKNKGAEEGKTNNNNNDTHNTNNINNMKNNKAGDAKTKMGTSKATGEEGRDAIDVNATTTTHANVVIDDVVAVAVPDTAASHANAS